MGGGTGGEKASRRDENLRPTAEEVQGLGQGKGGLSKRAGGAAAAARGSSREAAGVIAAA